MFFGKHTDWASEFRIYDGRTLADPIDLGIKATANESDIFTICKNNRRVNFRNEELLSIAYDKTEFFSLCLFSCLFDEKNYTNVKNVDIVIENKNLPLRAGLSSFTAISNLVIRAFDTVYSLYLTEKEIMDVSYGAESLIGSSCGRLDQIGVLKKIYMI